MIQIGRIAIFVWAIGMAWVGYRLIFGQGGVAMVAIENQRYGEAVMQFTFVTIVFVATTATCLLFFFVGVFNEGNR